MRTRMPTGLDLLTGKLALLELFAWGVLYYSYSVFLPPMREELGWSSATLGAGFSLALLVAGAAAPLVGARIDRHGSRQVMTVGAITGSLGIALWSVAHTLPVYLAAWTLIGAGMAGTLYAPAFTTVVRWRPHTHRGALLTITAVGALASTVFLPIAGRLEASLGWRGGLLSLAAVMGAVVTGLALSLPNAPAPSHHPDRQAGTIGAGKAAPGLRLLIGALMIADLAGVAATAHLVLFLVEQGLPLQTAASVAGLAGAAKLGGRLATAAGSRVSSLTLLSGSLALSAVSLALPLLWPSPWAAVAMVVSFGATSGARTILRPSVLVELQGPSGFGKKYGFLQLCTTIAKAAGPVGFGLALRSLGWGGTWPLVAALLMASGVLLLALRLRLQAALSQPAAAEPQADSLKTGTPREQTCETGPVLWTPDTRGGHAE